MKVFLFRHWAVRHKGEKLFLGRTDLPLSAEGRRQAEAWRHPFQTRAPGRIVASPLIRALEFAKILAGDRQADVSVCPELAEIDLGDWDGRPMRDIRQRDPASWQARGENLAQFRPPNGESFEDVQQRTLPAFQKLIGHDDPELIVVSHAGVNRAILCHLLGIPLANLFRIGQDYACLNVLETGPLQTRLSRLNVPCPGQERLYWNHAGGKNGLKALSGLESPYLKESF
ncbi:MAG: histidine phosphatase family protein [Desulfobacteraceae bacterium]|jgi:probable phosphoglycerate mutase|nr:histidine phosphatase family protein [Desulfobacteraceae bacterium]